MKSMEDQDRSAPIEIVRPDGGPLPENHHLEYRPDKKTFRVKVAVNVDGGKFVGKRLLIPTHTGDIEIARKVRDGVIVALCKAGVISRRVHLTESGGAAQGDDLER